MRRVVLESPYAGNIPANRLYARRCIRDCLQRGESAIASHLLYTQRGILRDSVPGERKLGIDAGHEWILVADAVVVYMDRGISDGMKKGITIAENRKVPIEYRNLRRGLCP
jgi:hypothetical protein